MILIDANGDSEVALYTSAKKNSPIPSNWNFKGAITEDMHAEGQGQPGALRSLVARRHAARRERQLAHAASSTSS